MHVWVSHALKMNTRLSFTFILNVRVDDMLVQSKVVLVF